jgi:four helix bundle protein
MEDFKDLVVWAKAHQLTLCVYQRTRTFPKEDLRIDKSGAASFGPIGANIAEGCGRRSDAEFKRFLQIARGSASELECHLLLARDLQFLEADQFHDLEAKVWKCSECWLPWCGDFKAQF